MIHAKLIRDHINPHLGIIGHFYWSYDGNTFGFPVIEHPKHDVHIPDGRFALCVTYSPKFKRDLPLVIVPNRKGIRFHFGSCYTQSKGCILMSAIYADLLKLLVEHLKQDKCILDVSWTD